MDYHEDIFELTHHILDDAQRGEIEVRVLQRDYGVAVSCRHQELQKLQFRQTELRTSYVTWMNKYELSFFGKQM